MAIPKKIHYCWLSREKMPDNYIKCIDSWKRIMPDYELVLWDGDKFDVNSVPFVKEAVSVKKWAFAADYIRLYAVYSEGGIYLDSDVLVLKKFDEFLKYDFFTSLEFEDKGNDLREYENYTNDLNNIFSVNRCGFQAGIFGGIKEHPYLKDCIEWYKNNSIFLTDGQVRDLYKIKAPDVQAAIANVKYGFKYRYGEQKLENGMIIFDTKVFCHTPKNANKDVYAIHWGEAGWEEPGKRFKIKMRRNKIYRTLRKLFTKKKYVPTLDEVIAEGVL
ncbi:MAG: polysaccharide biosynthesis protein [Chitinivibrionia bacterium]|nr:polysaccharide biosynthesis protein [Chitinivibrionia bacterium]